MASRRSPSLGAAPNKRLARTVPKDLATPVLDVAIAWAKRPAGCGCRCSDYTPHDRADWPSNHRPGDYARRCSCRLLRRLTRCRREADETCKKELSHEGFLLLR